MHRGTVLGFYQDADAARAALKRLRANRLYSSALLRKLPDGQIRVETDLPGLLPLLAAGAGLGLLAGFGLHLLFPVLFAFSGLGMLLCLVTLILGAWLAEKWYGVSSADVTMFRDRLVRDETLIFARTGRHAAAHILDLMRQGEGDNPITFALYPRARATEGEATDDVHHEPLPTDRLAQEARKLAGEQQNVGPSSGGRPLQRRLKASARAIGRVRRHLTDMSRVDSNILLAAEWLLDNSFVIEGHINDFRRSLPRKYEQELPVLIDEEKEKRRKGEKETEHRTPNTEYRIPEILHSLLHQISRLANWMMYDQRWQLLNDKIQNRLQNYLPAQVEPPLPRVYALSRALILNTDARLDRENMHGFLQEYQSVTPLTIGELWAVPLMLRLRLIEQLRALSVQVDRRQYEREQADFWANRLLTAARRDPDLLPIFVADLLRENPMPTPHFAEQLVEHLYDEETALAPIRDWLERRLSMTLADAFAQERTTQARQQVSLGNAISSLRELGRMDYTKLFEEVSRIDAILYSDPSGVYPQMDFATRDRYRHAIEEIARRSSDPEVTEFTVAFRVVALADEHQEGVACHVGYYLIDDGRAQLETELHSPPRPRARFLRWTQIYGTSLYLATIVGLTAAIVATLCLQSVWAGVSVLLTILLGTLAILPASEVAVQLVNYAATRFLPPRTLPKMDFEQGVPQTFRTLVVVPMMLLTPDSIQEEIDRLEIRFLANTDDNLRYALLSDYSDAPGQNMPEDAERLNIAMRGIEQLNAKYANGRFLLFHRERGWSETEGRWMGWERKRGKLEQMNALLMQGREGETSSPAATNNQTPTAGNPDVSLSPPLPISPSTLPPMQVRAGDVEWLRDIRFVITLDADTQLPRDTGRHLVETLAHPLNLPVLHTEGERGRGGDRETNSVSPTNNQPVQANNQDFSPSPYLPISPSVQRGYTILQPRVSTSLPSAAASYFSRLFTDMRGTDPYTLAVSDVYQDLAGEGSYHGKGIYDLAAFHAVLSERFPTSHLLSHDLIEGAHVRVGVVSDIELFDLFPRDYTVHAGRQHRWVRGDWQIADWLRSRVPYGSGSRIANPLNLLNHWKILDNLRRSLLPPIMALLLIVAWFATPIPAMWGWLVAWTFLTPTGLQLLGRVTTKWKRDPLAWRETGTSLLRALLFLSLLPHQAWLNVDAIARVWYRKLVSHHLMLEWETASEAQRRSKNRRRQFVLNMAWIPLLAIALGVAIRFVSPGAIVAAAPFLLLWAASPLFVSLLNREVRRDSASVLKPEDREMIRQTARLTWRFFDDHVTAETNWLPPDNYQVDLRMELAPRTSPTNIGLSLLAVLAAQDMGYLTLDEVVEKLTAPLQTLKELETYEGHLFNWYDIYTKQALPPRYVSFVDSGNLLGALWALAQGISERVDTPLMDGSGLRGLNDAATLLRASLPSIPNPTLTPLLDDFSSLLSNIPNADTPGALETLVRAWRALRQPAQALAAAVYAQGAEGEIGRGGDRETNSVSPTNSQIPQAGNLDVSLSPPLPISPSASYWAEKIQQQVTAWNTLIDRYLPWVEILAGSPTEMMLTLSQSGHEWARLALAAVPSLRMLGSDHVPGLTAIVGAMERLDHDKLTEPEKAWIDSLKDAHNRAQWFAGERLEQAENAITHIQTLADGMNLRFLYEPQRKAFSIGYNVEDKRLDNFYYDLLASEARLGSFVAVARGEVPVDHWFALGRPFATAYGQRVLLSWSGTMFEYLMPLLLTKHYENSLLDQGCRAAVAAQRAYGKKRGLPWGISEAAYSALDTRQIYQYQAFGVPGLGLKRGLEHDLVVAPYATALALTLAPDEAAKNLEILARRGMRGEYGFYESIDYTRQADAQGDPGVIVKTFMAHHQGMSLLAIDNLLNDDVMQRRFHADPRVQATESLLYERVPNSPPLASDYAAQQARTKAASGPKTTAPVRIPTPDTPTPRTLLLANAEFSALVTNAGSGYIKWKELEISRWRADTTRDSAGVFCYVKDLDSGEIWSTAAQPMGSVPPQYSVLFVPEKAEFTRRDFEIETRLEIVVSPEDNAEIRRITFVNHSDRPRHLEVTSYVEIALASHAADRAHPAFSKLFVQTESLPDHDALLASRRKRKSDDPEMWAAHIVAAPDDQNHFAQHETDRAKFLGRNCSPARPVALNADLSNSVGAVLDPIFSLRRRIMVAPGERVEVKFITGAGATREEVVNLAAKYCEIGAANRAVELAWTYAQLDLRHLRIQPDEAMRFQQLAGYVLYPSPSLRANEERLKRNVLAQPALWAHGISGDLPIVALTIADTADIEVARQIIVAHNYWRSKGLKCDLVILNEEAAGYDQPMQEQLRRLVQSNAILTGTDQPGGVFLRPSRDIPEQDLTLILSLARISLIAARGSLTQQLGNLSPSRALPAIKGKGIRDKGKAGEDSSLIPHPSSFAEEPSPVLPFIDLPYFNGTGGFTADGKEYVIYLGPGHQTPMPWINVMANPQFGTIVSESGMGFSWFGNSQSNRLTPWSNDPVLDPSGEALYIRDEDLDVVWTPTPRPIREQDAYRARHGQGYSHWEHNSHAIEQDLVTFVPVDDHDGAPVRIQRLRLRNAGSRKRRLTVTSFVEWTLGVEREDTQLTVVTEWDRGNQTMYARNAYHPDFGSRVAFTACQPPATSYTGDRTEFLGRNGSAADPAGLKRVKLSNRTGAGLDPCGALQTTIELNPGEEQTLLFVMGQGADTNEARQLSARFRNYDEVERALTETQAWWDKTLNVIQVDTPELSVNFLLNRWLLYQDLSCRLWGRSAFYQSGGAFGFRDQLQDIMAVLYAHPDFARAQILRSAARQFREGDVQHWWHPPSGAGVRTRISDDLLWLPFVTAQYIRVTGDAAILDEVVPFLDGKPLEPNEHEVFNTPSVCAETATLLEHCRRTIEKGHTSGPHGLPLMGAGDWNDGLNRVGAEGKGESVWLAWFLVHVLNDFAYLLREEEKETRRQGEGETDGISKAPVKAAVNSQLLTLNPEQYEEQARQLAATIEQQAWDGDWYRRAYFDDGTPLGSAENEEAKIDSLPQSWSVLSGMGDPERSKQALQSVEQYLVKDFAEEGIRDKGKGVSEENAPSSLIPHPSSLPAGGMVLLFTPAFDKTPHDPGYIKGYVPGVRENGGQYTHGSLWVPFAYAQMGGGDKACHLLRLMNPAEHTRVPESVERYKVEPYVVVADIYNLQGQEGRGGWSWYTGSAGWMYRAWLEAALGFQKRGATLTLNPSIPRAWDGFTLTYRYGRAEYSIRIENPQHVEHGVAYVELDGKRLPDGIIPLIDAEQTHQARVLLGEPENAPEPAAPIPAVETAQPHEPVEEPLPEPPVETREPSDAAANGKGADKKSGKKATLEPEAPAAPVSPTAKPEM